MKIKKCIITIAFIAALPFAVQLGHRLHKHYHGPLTHEAAAFQAKNLAILGSTPTGDDVYNYDRLLRLINQVSQIKAAYREHYANVDSTTVKPLPAKEIKRVLEDLYREKESLRRYAKNLRIRYKGNTPQRRARAIEYQMSIVEKSALAMEKMLRHL